ncbi:MAG: hypothetical protein KGL19_10935, partial [Bacteroidota bacterium]|nr:hypothetical protein [Bacteroidota bacterium]
ETKKKRSFLKLRALASLWPICHFQCDFLRSRNWLLIMTIKEELALPNVIGSNPEVEAMNIEF